MVEKSILERVKAYADVVQQHFAVQQIILFGSQTKGTAHPDSDIDVAVVFRNITGDYLETATKLHQLRRKIDSRIEPAIFEENHDPGGFLSEIRRTGTVVYSAESIN